MGGDVIHTARNKCKRKEGDSEEEEDEDDDSEDQGDDDNDEEGEESGGKKGKKVDICEEEVSVCFSECQPVHQPHTNEMFLSRTTVYTQPAWRNWRNRLRKHTR